MSSYATRSIGQPNTLGIYLRPTLGNVRLCVCGQMLIGVIQNTVSSSKRTEFQCLPSTISPSTPSTSSWVSGMRQCVDILGSEQKTLLNMVVEVPRWTNAKLEVGGIRLALAGLWS